MAAHTTREMVDTLQAGAIAEHNRQNVCAAPLLSTYLRSRHWKRSEMAKRARTDVAGRSPDADRLRCNCRGIGEAEIE